MTSYVPFGLVVAAVMSCGAEKLNDGTGGATGATTGSGGSVGSSSGGIGGTTAASGGRPAEVGGSPGGGRGGAVSGPGGAGGYPLCLDRSVPLDIAGTILAADGQQVAAPITATVTVSRVDSCTTSSCDCALCAPTDATLRLVLADTGAARTWTLLLRIPDLPAAFIKAGDVLDLTVVASEDNVLFVRTVNQTIVLARAGKVVAFTASLASLFQRPPLPELGAIGIGVADAGIACQNAPHPQALCLVRPHATRVTIETEIVTVAEGQTRQVGGYSFSVGRFVEYGDTGFCDAKSETVMAGFRLP